MICPACRRIRENDTHVQGINAALHRRARSVALDLGLTVGDIYNRSLQYWLENLPDLLTERDREILAANQPEGGDWLRAAIQQEEK